MSDWYIVENNETVGPLDDAEILRRLDGGWLSLEDWIWTQGMQDWVPVSSVRDRLYENGPEQETPSADMADPTAAEASSEEKQAVTCRMCGRSVDPMDSIELEGHVYCPECKPELIARIQEGEPLDMRGRPAGFWIRWVAVFIDSIITSIVNFGVQMIIFIPIGLLDDGSALGIVGALVTWVLNIAFAALYEAWFVARFAGTPGKLVLRLKVLRPDGSRLSFGRSLGRHFAKYISGFILMIGYLMAAFDEEKRALHDMICDTRVVRS